ETLPRFVCTRFYLIGADNQPRDDPTVRESVTDLTIGTTMNGSHPTHANDTDTYAPCHSKPFMRFTLLILAPKPLGNNFMLGKEIDHRLALSLDVRKLRRLHSAEGKIRHGGGNSHIHSDHSRLGLNLELTCVIAALS